MWSGRVYSALTEYSVLYFVNDPKGKKNIPREINNNSCMPKSTVFLF